MIAAILAAALSASVPTAIFSPPPSARAGEPVFPNVRPALWVVNDHDTVIYLFGTFHALDGQSDWFNDEVLTAFAGSDELILETIAPAHQQRERFAGEGAEAQIPSVGPDAGSGSFLSTSKMVMSAGRSRGMSTNKGADAILRRAAEETGKPVGGLESFDFQVGLFSNMPASSPAPSSPEQARQVDEALAVVLAQLQDAWNRGDLETFVPMLEQMRSRSPDNYRLLFLDRNWRFAGWIARRLQQPGTVFVAVGAGHLAGRDSIQQQLSQAGIRSARIN